MSNSDWMKRCEELGSEARAAGNSAVGAVIVSENLLIAEDFEQVDSLHDLTAHAEALAIKSATQTLQKNDLSGCVLYTNVEPCWMCSYLIRESKISRVVIGRAVDGIGGVTSSFPILTTNLNSDWNVAPEIVWLKD